MKHIRAIDELGKHVRAGTVVAISCGILAVLFLIQRNGTSKIGYAFSPVMLSFLVFSAGVGAYNIGMYSPSVFKV